MVIKDLLNGDGNKIQIVELNKELDLTREKVKLKDSVIFTLNSKVVNLETIILTKDEQFKLQQELSKKLEKELKSQKRKTFLYKLGTTVGIVSTVILIVK